MTIVLLKLCDVLKDCCQSKTSNVHTNWKSTYHNVTIKQILTLT